MRGGDPEKVRGQWETPVFSPCIAPAGGGPIPSPPPASMDTHPWAGGCPPLKPFSPL